jgi:hypothetical protein
VPATSISIIGNPGDGTWTKLGVEGATVTVPENTIVRYGANGQYLYAKVAGKFTINNTFFKSDPAHGFVKTAETWTAAGSSTPTNPTTPSNGVGNSVDAATLAAALSNLSGKQIIVTVL